MKLLRSPFFANAMSAKYPQQTVDLKNTVATIGCFDGIHLGHQAILKQAATIASQNGYCSLLISFEPMPWEYFAKGGSTRARLTTLREKIFYVQELVDAMACLRFNQTLANMTAQNFIEWLVNYYQIKILIVGEDFRFGHDRQGDVLFLQQFAQQHNIKLIISETITHQASNSPERISSTYIRTLLQQHQLRAAAALLGRNYTLQGRVVHGDKRGRLWGFPTINLYAKRREIVTTGVFVARVWIKGQVYFGALNCAKRFTAQGFRLAIETFIFDFDQMVYGELVTIELLHFLREDLAFASTEKLIAQIAADVQEAKLWIKNNC